MTDRVVTVAIVTFRTDFRLFEECVASARRSAERAGVEVEVLIADNSGNDHFAELRESADRWIDMGGNAGFARASNNAIASARGEYVLLLNPDAALDVDALAQLLAAEERHPGALFCGWLTAYGRTQVDAYLRWWTSSGRFVRRGRYRKYLDTAAATALVPVEKVSGGALFGRRDLLRALGPFDDRYFLYSEDVDLSYRASRAGVPLYAVKGAKVSHQASSSQASHSALVESARTDAAIRLNSYHLPYLIALATRLELALITLLGLLPGLGRSSGSRRVRIARFNQIAAWGLRREMPRFNPAGFK